MNSQAKVFAIGDIHGCDIELEELLHKLPLETDSTIIFLGDYVDRGPNSKAIIDTIIGLKKKYNTIALMGNHESMFLEFIKDPSSVLAGFFVLNGGSATLASYVTVDNQYEIPEHHIDFLNNLQLYHETETHLFVHAGLPNVAIKNIDPKKHFNDLLWIRRPFHESQFNWNKKIVHGHTPQQEVFLSDRRINLDTGCVFNGHLSAIEVHSETVYQVKTRREIPQTFLKASPEISRVAARFSGTIPVFVENETGYSEFLTVNYNEFGMLILEQQATDRIFEVGQVLRGKIGALHQQQIRFVGQVVRHQARGQNIAYGIKMIEPLSND